MQAKQHLQNRGSPPVDAPRVKQKGQVSLMFQFTDNCVTSLMHDKRNHHASVTVMCLTKGRMTAGMVFRSMMAGGASFEIYSLCHKLSHLFPSTSVIMSALWSPNTQDLFSHHFPKQGKPSWFVENCIYLLVMWLLLAVV